jgi:hypothetical protein
LVTELNFDDITPQSIPVRIGGKSYVLKEATGEAACRYKNEIMRCGRLGADGKPNQVIGLADTEAFLVSLCLFEVDGEGKEKHVPVSLIKSWKSSVLDKLYKTCREMSGMDNDEKEDELVKQKAEIESKLTRLKEANSNGSTADEHAKNLPSGTTDG